MTSRVVMLNKESLWHAKVRDLGCIVCQLFHGERSDGDIHHVLSGSKRAGEMFVICLCPTHHRSGRNTPEYVIRHPWRKAFEQRYGTEQQLLQQTEELCASLQK